MKITANARTVLERRYLAKVDGQVVETPEDMVRRVAKNIASIETDPQWEERFFEIMTKLEFLPNSPTLMNAGRALQQLSACFVLPIEDSMEGIFETLKNTALIKNQAVVQALASPGCARSQMWYAPLEAWPVARFRS